MHRPLLIFVALVAFGCSGLPTLGGMRLSNNTEAMQKEVTRHVSVGMPIEDARRVMKRNGFDCDDRPAERPYLYCSRRNGRSAIILQNEIAVSIYHDQGRVTQVDTRCSSFGP